MCTEGIVKFSAAASIKIGIFFGFATPAITSSEKGCPVNDPFTAFT